MRSRILQLETGNVFLKTPVLAFKGVELNGLLAPNTKAAFRVDVTTENKVPAHLYFYSDSVRVTIQKELQVVNGAYFQIQVSTKGLKVDDVLKGEITVCYNGGEIRLPYEFRISVLALDEKNLVFKRISDFSAFLKEHRRESFEFFGKPEFLEMPMMKNRRMQGLYHLYFSKARRSFGLYGFMESNGYPIADELPEEKTESKGEGTFRNVSREDPSFKYELLRTFIRYDYAERMGNEEGLIKVRDELLNLHRKHLGSGLIRLFRVYDWIKTGNVQEARNQLIRLQDGIQKEKQERPDIYCLFVYLVSLIQGDDNSIESAGKIIHRNFMENSGFVMLFLLEYRLNYMKEGPEKAYEFLAKCYQKGFRSTLLKYELAFLLKNEKDFSGKLDTLSLSALKFGLHCDLISEKRLFEVLVWEFVPGTSRILYEGVLKQGYGKFKNKELLQGIVKDYIEYRRIGERYFRFYAEAVDLGLTVDGLYENYLSSLPENHRGALPKDIINYFGYGREINSVPLDLLYRNILGTYKDDPIMMDLYLEKMQKYAMKRLMQEDYSVPMETVFPLVMKEEYLNKETAAPMLELYYLYRIETTRPDIRKLVVYYPEIEREISYRLTDQRAEIPVFSDEALFALEDEKGRRFFDRGLKKKKVYENDALKARCESMIKGNIILSLQHMNEILKHGIQSETDMSDLLQFYMDSSLSALYRANILECIFDAMEKSIGSETDLSQQLIATDFTLLNDKAKTIYLRQLAVRGHLKEILSVLRSEGLEKADSETCSLLIEKISEDGNMAADEVLMEAAIRVVKETSGNPASLRYLTEHYRGPAEEMYGIFRQIKKRKIDGTLFTEQALITALYTCQFKNMDAEFDYYMASKKPDESLRNAYLTVRSHQVLMKEKKFSETAWKTLRQLVLRLPKVCKMAYLTAASEQLKKLPSEDVVCVKKLLNDAVMEDYALGCFKKFEEIMALPFEFRGKTFMEYRNKDAKAVVALGQILPGRHYFQRTLEEVYPGIFVRTFILYPQEWIQYSFLILRRDGTTEEQEGDVLTEGKRKNNIKGLFDDLVLMESKVEKKSPKDSSGLLRKIIFQDAMVQDIFSDDE